MKHQHRFAILKYAKGNIWLLIIPLVRGLFSLRTDLYNWLKMAYMDIIVITVVFVLAWLKWYCMRYEITKKGIYVKTGLLFRKEYAIRYASVSCITFHQSLLLKPLKAVRIFINTNNYLVEKKHSKSEIILFVSEIDYSQIYKNIPAENSEKKIIFQASKREILFYSMVFSSAIPSLAYMVAFIIQCSRVVGEKIEIRFLSVVNELTESLRNFYDKVTATIVVLVLIIATGWLVSVAIKIMRRINFKISRCGGQILIENGLLDYWKYYVKYSSVNSVEIQQNLLMKIAGIMSVNINCTGYGKRRDELPVFIPMTTKRQAMRMMKELLPDFTLSNIMLRTKRTYIMAYVWLPAVLIIGVAVSVAMLSRMPTWDSAAGFVGIMLEIPLMYLLAVRIGAKIFAGIGVNDNSLTVSYCRGARLCTAIVPKDRIAYIKIRRTFFQRVGGCCDVIVYARGGHARGYRIRGIVVSEALWLVENYDKMCQNAHL